MGWGVWDGVRNTTGQPARVLNRNMSRPWAPVQLDPLKFPRKNKEYFIQSPVPFSLWFLSKGLPAQRGSRSMQSKTLKHMAATSSAESSYTDVEVL